MPADEPVHREIAELHAFFEGWFSGTLPDDDASFARLETAIAPDFLLVSPEGELLDRDAALELIRGLYGQREGLRIWTDKIIVRQRSGELTITTYEEWQQTEDGKRVRFTSCVLRDSDDAPNGLAWLHVHETWLPAE